MAKPKKNQKDRHHIVPTSRGGSDDPSNIVVIKQKIHQRYHNLFGNLTPEEIIDWLVTYFWGGNWDFVEEALKRRKK